jgi:hypothetical protein
MSAMASMETTLLSLLAASVWEGGPSVPRDCTWRHRGDGDGKRGLLVMGRRMSGAHRCGVCGHGELHAWYDKGGELHSLAPQLGEEGRRGGWNGVEHKGGGGGEK